jgi:hypothetical protein
LIIGTLVWLTAFVVLLFIGDHDQWLWISAAGVGLGLLGGAISEWQRAAARRGARGAQSGLPPKP